MDAGEVGREKARANTGARRDETLQVVGRAEQMRLGHSQLQVARALGFGHADFWRNFFVRHHNSSVMCLQHRANIHALNKRLFV